MALMTFLKSPKLRNLDKKLKGSSNIDEEILSSDGFTLSNYPARELQNENGNFRSHYQQEIVDDTPYDYNQKIDDTPYDYRVQTMDDAPQVQVEDFTQDGRVNSPRQYNRNPSNSINSLNRNAPVSNYNTQRTLNPNAIPKNNISYTSIATDASNYSSSTSNYGAPPLLIKTNSSNSDSLDFESPPMTPNVGGGRSRSNSSPSKRVLSNKMKATPSNLHRYSQNYDNASFQNFEPQSSQDTFISNTMILQSKLINENLPPELSPIVNLINCQKLRTYAVGVINIAGSLEHEKIWIEVEAKLTGNELALWRPSTVDNEYQIENNHDEFKPKYINLIDTKIKMLNIHQNEITLVHDYKTSNSISIKFSNRDDLIKWYSAIQLSKFEYVSLNEAYTAVLLSLKGSKLNDIHILLAPKKRFVQQEWINLRLPQITNKWLKLFMVITPSDSKSYGKIEFYKTDKINNKNLIAFVSNLDNIFNVFPEQVNMIDFNSIMKLQGEIYINKNFEYIFHSEDADYTPPDRSNSLRVPSSRSSNSISKGLTPPPFKKGHSRTNSENYETSNSFFSNAPAAQLSPPSSPLPKSPSKFRLRSHSLGHSSPEPTSRSRSSSFVTKNLDQFVTASYMYIMPITHPGVPAIETMIRNLIYIIDAFRLYGRPNHLISDKTNPKSFLFGLPSLPHFEYVSSDESLRIIEGNLRLNANINSIDWRSVFKSHLAPKMQAGYKGHGDIVKLYSSLDYSLYDQMPDMTSPHVNFPRGPSPEEDGFSDLVSDEGLGFNNQMNNTTNTSSDGHNDNLLGAPIDFKRQYNSSPLSNSFSNNGRFADQ